MFSKRLIFALMMVVIMVSSFGLDARAAGTVTVDWIRQFGTPEFDFHWAIAADASGVYAVGDTSGTLPGQTNAGLGDAYIRKYDLNGNELWTRQFGGISVDAGKDVAVDGTGVYVIGYTFAVLPGQVSSGAADVFVRKYDTNGNELWTRQFGTNTTDTGWAIDTYGSAVYVSGYTFGTFPGQTASGGYDIFVGAFDQNGSPLWTSQFGSATQDYSWDISANTSGVYVTGYTEGSLPGETSSGSVDAFLVKYDLNGNLVWADQFGSIAGDYGHAVAVTDTGVYAGGYVGGVLPGQTSLGNYDAFVRKYDFDGAELWTRQFGTNLLDAVWDMVADSSGAYLVGFTDGAFPGQTDLGTDDIFVRKYDPSGSELWTSQFGGNGYERGHGIAVVGSQVFTTGQTNTGLPGQVPSGSMDAFVIRLTYASDNQAPTAHAGGPYSGTEGAAIALDGSASSDPDADSLGYSWSVDSALCAFSDASLVSPSLTCAQDGSFTVSLEVSDGQQSHSATASVLVDNAAPIITALTAPVDPVQVNTSISASAAFSDAGTLDTHTADWDWGDGSTSVGSVSETGGAGSVADSHTYNTPGVYTLALTVSDLDGGNAAITHQYVVVYDPSGGFVTGAGKIQSPLGACQQLSICADVEGRAHFGFVSKYQKGANVPSGNTNFRFDAGGFIFESDTYDWLVVNQGGTNAQFKGSGLVNDQLAPTGAQYRFMIWAGDGTGSGGEDTFRIKIWYDDGGTEVVVYDNGTDQPIDGGQIRVHK